MERVRWTDKSITLRNLVDNSSIKKPALGKYFVIHQRIFNHLS
jgi:hypothetical protein